MGRKEKLIERLKSAPKDFTFNEAETLLSLLGYAISSKGKTSGARVMFANSKSGHKILLHKPHPRNCLLHYQVRQLANALQEEGLI